MKKISVFIVKGSTYVENSPSFDRNLFKIYFFKSEIFHFLYP